MQDNDKIQLFEEAPIPAAVAKLAVPTILSSLVMVLYNLADTYFVGMLNNPIENSAVTLAAPVLLAFNAVNNLFGVGSSSMMSRALGRKDYDTVARSSAFGFYCSVAAGLLFSLLCTVFLSPLLALLGATPETADATAGYLAWTTCLGATPSILNVVMAYLVRSEGNALHASIGTMSGCLLNIVLDPIFISVLGQGTAGAAIATSLGNIMASVYYLWYFLRKSHMLSISWKDFTWKNGILTRICSTGLPTAIFSALMSVSTIVLNQMLVVYGNAPVAAIGIVFKANMFITFLQMGLANGVQPLLGYNYGSGDGKRFRAVESFTKRTCLAVGILATLLYFVLREPIIRLFINDDEVVAYGVEMLTAYMLSGPVIGFLFVNMNSLQSVGHALEATVLSVLRQGVLLIPLLYLLQAMFGLTGVIFGQSVTDYAAVILSAVLWSRVRAGLPGGKDAGRAADSAGSGTVSA